MSDIERWRKRIDEIDEQLLRLLNERAQCAVEVGHLKKQANQSVWQPERELAVLRHAVTSNKGPLDDAAIRRLFERIIDEARSLERRVMREGRSGSAGGPEAPSAAGTKRSTQE
jgi:chorismate mutase